MRHKRRAEIHFRRTRSTSFIIKKRDPGHFLFCWTRPAVQQVTFDKWMRLAKGGRGVYKSWWLFRQVLSFLLRAGSRMPES